MKKAEAKAQQSDREISGRADEETGEQVPTQLRMQVLLHNMVGGW